MCHGFNGSGKEKSGWGFFQCFFLIDYRHNTKDHSSHKAENAFYEELKYEPLIFNTRFQNFVIRVQKHSVFPLKKILAYI